MPGQRRYTLRRELLLLLSTLLPALAFALPPPVYSPVPIVIWHGLGDRYDAPGLLGLKSDLESRADLEGVFVHIVKVGDDGSSDQRATFFGNANNQVEAVCKQLAALPELTSPTLNPSGHFDAIGFSQGGQLLRAVVERCTGGSTGLHVRNLITVGSQHMGISALPPCPPGSSPFSTCRLMHLSIVREGIYSSFAQHNLVPAQYFRDEARIDDYLSVNSFLRDINNERVGDEEVGPVEFGEDDPAEPRNATYRANLASLSKLVLLRFSNDVTVVPPQTAHFTLPSPNASNCPSPPLDPSCYLDPVPYPSLPLFAQDYIGLKSLEGEGRMVLGMCEGAHMEIDEECWEGIVSWLGRGDGRRRETAGRGLVWQG